MYIDFTDQALSESAEGLSPVLCSRSGPWKYSSERHVLIPSGANS